MTAARGPSPAVLAILRVAAAQRRGAWVAPLYIGVRTGRSAASVGASARGAIHQGWLRRRYSCGGPVYRITAAGRALLVDAPTTGEEPQ